MGSPATVLIDVPDRHDIVASRMVAHRQFLTPFIHPSIQPEVNIIMSHTDNILDRVKATQKTVFAKEQQRRPLKAIAIDSEVGYTTVQSHAQGHACMSLACFNHYIEGGVSPELLSLLLPDGFQIVTVPESVNHDELAEMMHDWLQTKSKAHTPESPAGRELSDCEKEALNSKAAGFKVVA